jgi:hypothetical protein
MVPPDWAPSNSSNTLVKLGTESFAMADPDHDGNWTVNIPAVNFTNHASGPSNFTFFIAAEEQNGDSATNVPVNVRFTETGMLPPDNLSPQVLIDRPLEGRVYSGSINVNGTAADDVCLDKAEVYVDGTLQGTVYLTSVSTSFFDVGLNTNLLPNGNNTIFVKTYDKAGNNNNQTIVFYVQNSIHDVSVTGMVTDKTVVGLAWASDINVTVANIGSIQESFNLSIYANATCIANTSVNLSSQNFSTLTLRSSTTNLTYGTYILTAYASLVSGENNTANNVLTQTAIAITIPGDINGDFKVSLADLVLLANAYGSTPGNAKWNPNADINGNNKADLADLVLMANHYGQHYP